MMNRSAQKDQREMQKLVAQHKREKKGAIRELRRDTQFIAQHREQEQRTKDQQYKDKIKGIMGTIGQETGELRKLDKQMMKLKKKK
jgi:nucleolar protein 14